MSSWKILLEHEVRGFRSFHLLVAFQQCLHVLDHDHLYPGSSAQRQGIDAFEHDREACVLAELDDIFPILRKARLRSRNTELLAQVVHLLLAREGTGQPGRLIWEEKRFF